MLDALYQIILIIDHFQIDESNFLRSETKEMEFNLRKLSRDTEDLKLELKNRSNTLIDRSREIHLEQEILELR